MAMKTLDEVRNELAELFCSSQTGDDYTSYDLEYCYKSGFDSGIAEMKKRNQVLVDAIQLIAEEMFAHGEYSGQDMQDVAGKALQQYKESVG